MLKGILSISGHSGLFKLIAEAKNNIIVESLTTQKRMPAYSTSKISALEDIAIFTDTGEVNLKEVFKAIYELEEGGPAPDAKSSANELKIYFEKVLPEYDKERVYISDIKKVLSWYNLLLEAELLNFEEEAEKEGEDEKEDSAKEDLAEEA
ncbi:MAG: DUF5606 domain-containing protein [Prolixibacteraceae bacterium]|nr:DUF5606 domain-containing protein [Prolixibacteraceae bacterium]